MNGVRRLFNGNGGSPPKESELASPSQSPPRLAPLQSVAPLAISLKGPSWPPESPTASGMQSPPTEPSRTTAALFLRKDKQRPVPVPSTDDGHVQPSPSTPALNLGRGSRNNSIALATSKLNGSVSRASPGGASSGTAALPKLSTTNGAGAVSNPGDQLFLSLLSSEAVVDSRDYQVMQAEEVEELKKEEQALSVKLAGLSRKVALETKIRDAAMSLSRANASYKQMSKQTNEQLETSERKLVAAQQEFSRVNERVNEINRRLLEHRAAVLSLSVRNLEDKLAPMMRVNGGRATPDGLPSRSSLSALSPSAARFDGAHLFAGHAGAMSPQTPRHVDVQEVEDKLKAATDALGAASRKQADMTRELSMLRLEKEEAETTLSIELQSAEETVVRLTAEVEGLKADTSGAQNSARLESELVAARAELATRDAEALDLERRLLEAEARAGDQTQVDAQLERLREEHQLEIAQLEEQLLEVQTAREEWEQQKTELELEHASRIQSLQQDHEGAQSRHEDALRDVNGQLDDAQSSVSALMQTHGIMHTARDTSLAALMVSVGAHLEASSAKMEAHAQETETWEASRRKHQEDIQLGLDKRQELAMEVEEARREREEARREVRLLEVRLREQTPLSPTSTLRDSEYSEDVSKVVAALQPIWAVLPAPETRAQKMSTRGYNKDVLNSPSTPGSPKGSLSEMDVRALKSLYDPNSGSIRSSQPSGPFSIQGFVSRVQALIADDRALIERLVRFAQAHDLLKKNAERAQKLAQESNVALETYSKQVKTLEDRNLTMLEKSAAMEEEVQRLQQTIERLTLEKQELEARAAAQAETCQELQEANDTLSARTLALAGEATTAAENTRRQLQGQLTECQKALDQAQEEIAMLQDRNMTMMERQAEMEEQLQKRR